MKKVSLLITAVTIVVLSSCTKQPTASFTVSNSGDIEIGDEVDFSNSSTDAKSYSWSFGDGETSTSTSPSHEYTSSGTFIVSLTANNKKKTDSYSQSVTIESCDLIPHASFAISNSGNIEEYEEVTFVNNSTGAESYSWDFGDNKTSLLENPTHKYYDTGTYTITLTVTACNKTDTYTKTITITERKGSIVLWSGHSGPAIRVVWENSYAGNITQYYSSYPDCGESGCVTITDLESGWYSFFADEISSPYRHWESNNNTYVSIGCNRLQLTISKSGEAIIEVINKAESSNYKLINNKTK